MTGKPPLATRHNAAPAPPTPPEDLMLAHALSWSAVTAHRHCSPPSTTAPTASWSGPTISFAYKSASELTTFPHFASKRPTLQRTQSPRSRRDVAAHRHYRLHRIHRDRRPPPTTAQPDRAPSGTSRSCFLHTPTGLPSPTPTALREQCSLQFDSTSEAGAPELGGEP